MVGDIVRKNSAFLRRLATTKSEKIRKRLLNGATSEQILALVEICVNILKFRFRLRNLQRHKLAMHAPVVRKLGRARSEKTARRILQTGGGNMFGSLILPVLSAVVDSLISSQ